MPIANEKDCFVSLAGDDRKQPLQLIRRKVGDSINPIATEHSRELVTTFVLTNYSTINNDLIKVLWETINHSWRDCLNKP